jgi:K+-sensing histidine kinase KdpD
MNQAIETRQAIVRRKPQLPKPLSTIQRYGLALLSVAVALGAALLLQRLQFRDVEVPLFLFAVAVAAWFGGGGAAVLALLLSCVIFDYFFIEPLYRLAISLADLPYFISFAALATLITWFSTVRRPRRERASSSSRRPRNRSGGTNATGQFAESHTRHHFRPRHERRHHLLESGSAGAVRLDGEGSDRQTRSRAFAAGLSGAD